MNPKTDTTLAAANADTTSIVISNDSTLGPGDMERIAEKIAKCPKLDSLTISGCDLTDSLVLPLIAPLATHPSLTKINFSQNKFTSPEFVQRIVNGDIYAHGNARIHTVDLSGNKQDFNGNSYKAFLQSIVQTDHIAVLKLTGDPWMHASHRHADDIIQPSVNLLVLEFGTLKDEKAVDYLFKSAIKKENKTQFISTLCNTNENEAARLLARVVSAQTISGDDAEGIRKRLPAVLYLAEKAHGRAKALELLSGFDAKLKQTLNLSIGIEAYMPPAPGPVAPPAPQTPPSTAVPTASSAPPADPYSLKTILEALGTLTQEDIIEQIRLGAAQPLHLAELGKNALDALGKISVASLHAMNTAPTVEPLLHQLNDFAAKFTEAGNIIEKITGRSVKEDIAITKDELLARDTAIPSQGFHLWRQKEKPKTLADAAIVIEASITMLSQLATDAGKIREGVEAQLETIYEIIGGYEQVGNQLKNIREVAGSIAKDLQKDMDVETEGMLPVDKSEPPEYHLAALTGRLDYLARRENTVETDRRVHSACSVELHQQVQEYSDFLEQSLPMLDEEVKIAARRLKTAAQLPTSSITASNIDAAAALGAMRVVNTQIDVLRETLRHSGEEASSVVTKISQLFSSQVTSPASPSPPRRSTAAQPAH